ncbi:MAG: tetratricopeptide repeat protein [Candidatus Xenobiia bacterium LiM19]
MKASSTAVLLIFLCVMAVIPGPATAEPLQERLGRDARLHESLGDLYFQRDSIREAALEWEKSIRLAPEYAPPYFKLATLYSRSGLVEKSIFYLEKGLSHASGNAFGQYNLAVLLSLTGREDSAVSHLISSLRVFPMRASSLACRCHNSTSSIAEPFPVSLRAHCLLGSIYYRKGDRKKAVFELSRSFLPLERLCSSKSPEIRTIGLIDFMLGESLSLAGSGLDAVVRSPHMIALDTGDGRTLYRRDISLAPVKNGELVTQEGYRTGIRVPEKASVVTIGEDGAVTAISSDSRSKTLKLGKLKLVTFPSPWALRPVRGGFFAETQGSGSTVIASPDSVVVTVGYKRMNLYLPSVSEDWAALAEGCMKMMADSEFCESTGSLSIDDEAAICEQAVTSPDKSSMSREEALLRLGTLYFEKGDAAKALDSLSKSQARSPFILYNLGFVKWKTGRHEDAVKDFRSAVSSVKSSPDIEGHSMLLGRALLFLGLYEKEHRADDKAMKYLRESIALDPSTGYEAYLPIAEILASKGDRASALIYLFEYLNAGITVTTNPLDLAILGDSSFRLKDGNGKTVLTRRGRFGLDKNGEIVSDEGLHTGIRVPQEASNLWFSLDGELSGCVNNKEERKFGRLEIAEGSAPIKYRTVGRLLNKSAPVGEGGLDAWRLLARLLSSSGGSIDTIWRAIEDCKMNVSFMPQPKLLETDPVTGQCKYEDSPPQKTQAELSSGDEAWKCFYQYLRARNLLYDVPIDEEAAKAADRLLYTGTESKDPSWAKTLEETLKELKGKSLSDVTKPVNRPLDGCDKNKALPWDKSLEKMLEELEALSCRDNDLVICLSEASRGAIEKGKAPREIIDTTIRELESLSTGPEKSSIAPFYCAWLNEKRGDPDNVLVKYQQYLDMHEKSCPQGAVLPLRLRARLARLDGMVDPSIVQHLLPECDDQFAFPLDDFLWKARKRISVTALSDSDRTLYALSRSGLIHEKKGEYEKAIACYRRYMQMKGLENPDISTFIVQSLTRVYYKAGLLDEVRNELDLMNMDLQTRNLQLSTLFTLLGEAYLKGGQEGKAYECYATARKIQRDFGLPDRQPPPGSH